MSDSGAVERYREFTDMPPRMFVVGDIHGSLSELAVLMNFLEKTKKLSQEDRLVFIGDYVDRGPDSMGVIDLLMSVQQEYPETVFLRGNHESMLLDFLGFEGSMGAVYIPNGGKQTLESYGISPVEEPQNIVKTFPKAHVSFLLNLDRYVIAGDYVCVHAGFNPLRDIHTQIDDDIYWIRDEFIGVNHHFGKTIVYGHTPYHDIGFNLPYRIGIDTGVVYKNRLSCVELVGKEYYQVKAGEKTVLSGKFPG